MKVDVCRTLSGLACLKRFETVATCILNTVPLLCGFCLDFSHLTTRRHVVCHNKDLLVFSIEKASRQCETKRDELQLYTRRESLRIYDVQKVADEDAQAKV